MESTKHDRLLEVFFRGLRGEDLSVQRLAEEYGKMIEPKKSLGHGNGQYCFGLYYNIPNNSLPIFWSSNNWTPIFLRKEKYQNAKQAKRKYSYFI